MNCYQAERPPVRRLGILPLLTAAVAIVALGSMALPSFAYTKITVDGTERSWLGVIRASDVFVHGWLASSAGDLVDRNGDVVALGRGKPPELLRDGDRLESGALLRDGDVLNSVTGKDVVEGETVTVVPDPIRIRHVGEGPLEALVNPGVVGVRRQVVGAGSARVFVDEVVEPAQPMVIRRHGPSGGRKTVALTFDDGPWPGQTDAILRILAQENVRATFFLIGSQVQRYPDIARRVRDGGHSIGNHTQSHLRLDVADHSTVRREITQAQETIQRLLGVRPAWFRAPGGRTSMLVNREAARFEMRIAGWTVDPRDWRKPPVSQIVSGVLAATQPGSVILLHDGGGVRNNTIEALGPIVRELKKRGYTFVTLDDLD